MGEQYGFFKPAVRQRGLPTNPQPVTFLGGMLVRDRDPVANRIPACPAKVSCARWGTDLSLVRLSLAAMIDYRALKVVPFLLHSRTSTCSSCGSTRGAHLLYSFLIARVRCASPQELSMEQNAQDTISGAAVPSPEPSKTVEPETPAIQKKDEASLG